MKVRLTAFNISSIDIKMVMMLRRLMKPAMPIAKSTALRIRYQERGTEVILVDLLSAEHDGADERDQDQNRDDFEGEQIIGEEQTADLGGTARGEYAESDARQVGHGRLNDEAQHA